MPFFTYMSRIDRRYIYGIIALAVAIPLLKPVGLPLAVSPLVNQAYQALQQLPDGAMVLIGFDYEPGSVAEVHPQAVAILRILVAKNMKVVTFTSFPVSGKFADQALKASYAPAKKVYGEDYVNLGYYAGAESSLAAFCENPRNVFKADYNGTPIDSLPLMKKVTGIKDFAMAITFNDGPGTGCNTVMWVRQANISHKRPLLLGVTGISGPGSMPYLDSKNVVGVMVGLKAAAELEQISGKAGVATSAMDALSISHLLVVFMILVGNVGLFVEKRHRRAA